VRVQFPAGAGSTIGWDDFTGKRIGKFEVVGTLGRRAFGIVLKARDQELDRTVVQLPPLAGTGVPVTGIVMV
jgi:hypothetical protein